MRLHPVFPYNVFNFTERTDLTKRYEFHLKGHLDVEWLEMLEGLTFEHTEAGNTRLAGSLADQAALHGLLARFGDLGVEILMVVQQAPPVEKASPKTFDGKELNKMKAKNPWIAAVLNFFFMGPGTLYIGRRKALGAALTIGAIVLTYVELQLRTAAPSLFPLMFGAVFLLNTFLAIDGYREAQEVNQG